MLSEFLFKCKQYSLISVRIYFKLFKLYKTCLFMSNVKLLCNVCTLYMCIICQINVKNSFYFNLLLYVSNYIVKTPMLLVVKLLY